MQDTKSMSDLLSAHGTGEIADTVGVSLSTVSNWRAGRARPARRHWRTLAEMLDVPVPSMVTWMQSNWETRHPAEYDTTARRIAELNPKARRAVMAALRAAETLGTEERVP